MVARHLQDYADQPTTDEIRTLLQNTASVNKTNSTLFNTHDLLVYASCDPDNDIVDISEWKITESRTLAPPTHEIGNGDGLSTGLKVIVFISSFAVVFFSIVGFACLFIYLHYRCKH